MNSSTPVVNSCEHFLHTIREDLNSFLFNGKSIHKCSPRGKPFTNYSPNQEISKIITIHKRKQRGSMLTGKEQGNRTVYADAMFYSLEENRYDDRQL